MADAIIRDSFTEDARGLLMPIYENIEYDAIVGAHQDHLKESAQTVGVQIINHLSTPTNVGRHFNAAPSTSYRDAMRPVKVYELNASRQWSSMDEAKWNARFPNAGISSTEFDARRVDMAIHQRVNSMNLYGSGFVGEGLLNQLTEIPFPMSGSYLSTFSGDEAIEYNAFLMQQIGKIQAKMFNNGNRNLVIMTSPEVLNSIAMTIVPVQASQQKGAGVDSMGGMIKRVVEGVFGGLTVSFIANSQLRNTNGFGKHSLILLFPENKPTGGNGYSAKTTTGFNNAGMDVNNYNTVRFSWGNKPVSTTVPTQRGGGEITDIRLRFTPLVLLRQDVGVNLEVHYEPDPNP